MNMRRHFLFLSLLLLTVHLAIGQHRYGVDPASPLIGRITTTPADILQSFHDAGMDPREHQLTAEEKNQITRILAALPPLHQKVLAKHLVSFSFLDEMPNNALTTLINPLDSGFRVYHITFRAALLHQNVSDWLTAKERTCFEPGDPHDEVAVEAGALDALLYVVLHEATHVVDGSLGLLPVEGVKDRPGQEPFATGFMQGVWAGITAFAPAFQDTLLLNNRFRHGKPYPATLAVQTYKALMQTPFVSLYSTSSRHEDLAELLTVYHLVYKLHQPFKIVVRRDGKPVFTYEPMRSKKVKARTGLLGLFYADSR